MPVKILKVTDAVGARQLLDTDEVQKLSDALLAEFRSYADDQLVKITLDFEGCQNITAGAAQQLGRFLAQFVIRRDNISPEWYIMSVNVQRQLADGLSAGLQPYKRVVAVVHENEKPRCQLVGSVKGRESKVDKEPYKSVIAHLFTARKQMRPSELYRVPAIKKALHASARKPKEYDDEEMGRNLRRVVNELYYDGLLVKLEVTRRAAPYIHIAWFVDA